MSDDNSSQTQLTDLTSTTSEHREALLRWFAGMTDAERLDVIQLQRDLIRGMVGQGFKTKHPEVTFAALVNALAKRESSMKVLSKRPSKDMPEKQLKELQKKRADSLRRSKREGKLEKDYRIKYHGLVSDLREDEGFGWRLCAEYLQRHHRFKISHQRLSQLHKKYAELEGR
jgi:hypothetical protein